MRRVRIRKKRALLLVDAVLLVIFIGASAALIVTLIGYGRDRAEYRAAQSLALSTPLPALPTPTPAPQTREAAVTDAPQLLETPPVTVDFAAIRAEGRHVRGWIYSADTVINYPVVYYTNNEYYLTHDYKGERSNAGAIFFDTRLTKELIGDNLILYGHHMKDRSMFGSLLQYQKQEYYDAHPVMYLMLENAHYRIDLFSGRFADSDMESYPVWFNTPEERKTYIQNAKAHSDFTPRDAAYDPDRRVISLVTCAYSNYIEDAKYQVMGWLTEIG